MPACARHVHSACAYSNFLWLSWVNWVLSSRLLISLKKFLLQPTQKLFFIRVLPGYLTSLERSPDTVATTPTRRLRMQPSTLDDICAAIGYTATRKLVAWFGGRKLYIPTQASPGHPFATALGFPAYRALVENFGVEVLSVPKADEEWRYNRNRVIAERLADGDELAAIASDLGLTLRRAEQIRVDLVADGFLAFALGYAGPGRQPAAGAPPHPELVTRRDFSPA